MSGRPLRFLAVVLGGWVALRMAMLWPVPVPPIVPPPTTRPLPVRTVTAPPSAWPLPAPAPPIVAPAARASRIARFRLLVTGGARRLASLRDPSRLTLAMLALTRIGPAMTIGGGEAERTDRTADGAPPATPLRPGSRWSASAWLIARGGAGLGQSPFGGLSGGQLGGSQAGARIAYAVDRQRRIALVARAAAPLSGPGSEAAIGVEWQPSRAPVRLVAEQRIGIDPGLGGPAVGVVGGVGPVRLGNFRLEAYGQAGVIARGQGVGYADGAVRVERSIARHRGLTLSGGAGLWGAAQPGAERIDAGPLIGIGIPVVRRRVRISLEWRERLGGRAAPGSGPALSIGGDF